MNRSNRENTASRWLGSLAMLALLAGCASEPDPMQHYQAYVAEHLQNLQLVDDAGVPRERPRYEQDYTQLPDFAAIKDVSARKQAFFDYLRPAIDYQNALAAERRKLLGAVEIKLTHKLALSAPEKRFIANMRKRYRIPAEQPDLEALPILKRRLDAIPASMVLAQAALESGWGTSRFAREANNLFGQWCFEAGCGVVPASRNEGARHEVARYERVDLAINAYFRNINSHPYYVLTREIREEARADEEPLSGVAMAVGLERYSARGEDYVEELRQVISYNGLE